MYTTPWSATSLLDHPEVRHSSGLGLQHGIAVDPVDGAGGIPVVHNGRRAAVHIAGVVSAVFLHDVDDILIGGTDGACLTAVGADEDHSAVLPLADGGTGVVAGVAGVNALVDLAVDDQHGAELAAVPDVLLHGLTGGHGLGDHQNIVGIKAREALFGDQVSILVGNHLAAANGQARRHGANGGVGGTVIVKGTGVDDRGDLRIAVHDLVHPDTGIGGGEAGGIGTIVIVGSSQGYPGGVFDDHNMGGEGIALVLLDADAVGVVVPLVAVLAGDGAAAVDDDLAQVRSLIGQLVLTGILNGIHLALVHEEARNPLGGAGLQQGHGQHLLGLLGGAVEDGIGCQGQGTDDHKDQGEQQQEEPADDSPKNAAFFLLFRRLNGYIGLGRIAVWLAWPAGRFVLHNCYLTVCLALGNRRRNWRLPALQRPSAAGSYS